MYTVIFRYEPDNEDESDEIRYYFGSLEAITRHLPDIVCGRLHDVGEALDACGKTVDEMVAFLAERKNLCKFLELGNNWNVVCAYVQVHN